MSDHTLTHTKILDTYIPRIAVIADDLTGCGDVGYNLAYFGIKSRIITDPRYVQLQPRNIGCAAIVVNTQSRTIPSAQAYQRTYEATRHLAVLGACYFFKKIDSTLRGNIGRELDAFIDALRIPLIYVVAAFPALGRTTVRGTQYVYNRKLKNTYFARDPHNQLISSHIPTLLKKTSQHASMMTVCDAVTDKDLARIAHDYPSLYYAGAAGIMRELLPYWTGISMPKQNALSQRSIKKLRKTLIVCGSSHPVNIAQINTVVRSTHSTQFDSAHYMPLRVDTLGSVLFRPEERGLAPLNMSKKIRTWIIQPPSRKQDPRQVLKEICLQVITCCSLIRFDRIILIGGETAYHVCNALRLRVLDIITSIEPGIVLTRAHNGAEIILKSGGFGTDATLLKCVKF